MSILLIKISQIVWNWAKKEVTLGHFVCVIKSVIFPSRYICVYIIPNAEIVRLTADNMVVVSGLPYIFTIFFVAKSLKCRTNFAIIEFARISRSVVGTGVPDCPLRVILINK